MAVSVVEVAVGNLANVASATLAVAGTPQAGDLVVVIVDTANNAGTITVSGLGATWVEKSYDRDTGGPAQNTASHAVFFGTGATASGNISVTLGNSRYGTARSFVVRGLSSFDFAVDRVAVPSAPGTTNISGPSVTADLGQIVFDMWMTGDTATTVVFPATQTPSGWTAQANYRNIVGGNFNTAYRIPGSSAAHQLTATSVTAKLHWISQFVVGSAGTAPITGSVSATRAGHAAAIAGTVTAPTFTGTVAATRAAHTAAIAGSVTPAPVTGVLAATGPAHTASIDGTAAAPGTVTGALDATGPSHTAAIAGDVEEPTVTGVLDATGPGHTAAIAGTATGTGDSTGVLAATRAPHQAAIYGQATSNHLDPWTEDLSQRTLLPLVTSGSFEHFPPLELPPAGMVERPLVRRSVIVPDLATIPGAVTDPATGELRIPDHIYDALPLAAPEEVLGTLHVLVGGPDVTYFRGKLARPLSDRSEEPFGDQTAALDLPALTSMDEDPDSPAHPLWWSQNRANVEFVLKRPDGTLTRLWSGLIVSDDTGNDQSSRVSRRDLIGSLYQAAHSIHHVPNMLDQTDIGTLIPEALNRVTSRRYPKIANVTTGIVSRARGSWSDKQLGYAQNLLATAQELDGDQWTVAKKPGTRWTYEMRQKKTGSQWTVTNGARGVKVNLSRDLTQGRNVIYGRGVGPDGYAWRNTHYPNLRADDAPLYPGATMSLGSSGAGVVLWQQRARELGYTIAVDGTLGTGDIATVRTIQRRYGLTVDGIIGAQTWAATFDVGANGGNLRGVVRLPLAADPRTQKWLYNADGSRAGLNPAYDGQHLVIEDDVDFGSGVTRAEGLVSAQQIVDREMNPALTGTIELSTDPREGSRMLIPEGDRITVIGYKGADRVLHIVARERDWQARTVRLTVDERARDAMTVAQIRMRDKESRRDPARRPGNVNRRSRLDVDQVVPFDGESGAGRIPKFALQPRLWSVIRVPFAEIGRVAKIDVRTGGKFAFALFGAPIKPAHLIKYVGANPLALDSPYEAHKETLEDRFGFIEGWGSSQEAAGEQAGVAVGRLLDTGGFEFVSARPPWLWVAAWSASPTFLSGRILPATDQ